MDKSILRKILNKYKKKMSDNDRSFFNRIYSVETDVYMHRLKAIGFNDKSVVLDAGCGFGQWSLALAKLNDYIHAVDMSPDRITILNDIITEAKINNIKTKESKLEKTPFKDNSFDAIFCYAVIFCTSWEKTINEFYRILKMNGSLYFTANDLGWYINLWKSGENNAKDYNSREYAALGFSNTIEYEKSKKAPKKGQIIIEYETMTKYLRNNGFKIYRTGSEGTIKVGNTVPQPKSFFKSSYYGLNGVYEILSRKEEG